MAAALAYGARSAGRTWPNPFVGCIIVKNGCIIGRGRTADGGRPHAEQRALDQAADDAANATAYVSLEPCTGHPAACTSLLVEAGIGRVVTAIHDVDPRMQGQGLRVLHEAGIETTCGTLASEAQRAHRGFFFRITRQRPMITLKMASSFDGNVALASGESRWITCSASRRLVHLMRTRHDAVMVGSGTATRDNPTLTPRGLGIDRSPIRIVIDSTASLRPEAVLCQECQTSPLWICHTERAPDVHLHRLMSVGAIPILCQSDSAGRVMLGNALKHLAERGITRVLCEGGPTLAAALIGGDFIDDIVGFTAGRILGADAQSAISSLALDRLADAPTFQLHRVEQVGACICHVWTRDISAPPR